VRIHYELQGIVFECGSDKADGNIQNMACLSTPAAKCSLTFVKVVDASNPTESREAAFG
jgi:hypothetical protein